MAADAARRDDAALGAVHHYESIVAAGGANAMVSQVECDLESVMSTRVEILVTADLSIVVSLVLTSSLGAVRTDLHLRATESATLAAKWDLTSNDRTKERACDPYGKDGCGTDESGIDSALEVRGVGWVFEVDYCSRVLLVMLPLPGD